MPPTDSTRKVSRHQWFSQGDPVIDEDYVTEEEPLEIRIAQIPLAVVMRTPGHDKELARGFALTEGIVSKNSAIQRISHCTIGEQGDNIIQIVLAPGVDFDSKKFSRQLYSTSSCGICGKRSIEQAMREAAPLAHRCSFHAAIFATAVENLRNHQPVFARTGSLHAAALITPQGEFICVREDIGRHNAVDKVIGHLLHAGSLQRELALIVSGRVSYDIVQKALAASISYLVAVGGVSTLAIDLAERSQITLIGFASQHKLSIYTHPQQLR